MNPSFGSMPMGVGLPGGPSPSQTGAGVAALGAPSLPSGGGQQQQQQLIVPTGQQQGPPPPQQGLPSGQVAAQAVPPPTGAPGPILGGQQVPTQGAGVPPAGAPPGQVSGVAAPVVRMAGGPGPGGPLSGPPPTPPSAAFPPAMRPFAPPPMMPNFMSAPPVPMPPQQQQQQPQQQMMPPGVLGTSPAGMPPRYSAPPFNSMAARPSAFAPRPPLGPPPPVTMSAMSLARPPGNGLRPIPPVLKPPPGMSLTELAAKGVGQLTAPPEKPHTTVYVGKIAPTIEDDFLRALLELCGDIKSWKRAQDPTTGSPKGFGFCEFESAEGVLRALRILNKYNLEGQELVLNVNQATREYLERYVAKKKEREKFLQQQAAEMEKDEELAPGVESIETPKPPPLFSKDDGPEKDSGGEEDAKKFGLVSAADIQGDELATQKMNSMLEERSRLRPLPPPPPLPTSADGLNKSVDTSSKSRDGDVSADATKSDDPSGKNDDDTTSDHRASGDNERSESTSADKGGRRSERDRERYREREIEREKERELERYERERERERSRREREREMKVREAERLYEERERDWEAREREKERQRLHDREREKDRGRDRRKEIQEQEEESDDDDWKKSRYRGSLLEEKRKRRLREREEDIADREREELEILSKRQKICESPIEKESDVEEDDEMDVEDEETNEVLSRKIIPTTDSVSFASVSDAEEEHPQKILNSNGTHNPRRETEVVGAVVSSEADPKASPAPRKLGFGIMGSGRRATGLSVFHQEDEEEKTEDRRLRPLVPIDYSAEEIEAVATPNPPRASSPQVASNLAAAAEFARSLSGFAGSNVTFKEDRKEDGDRDRGRRKRDRHDERDSSRKEKTRDRDRDREREREREDRDRDREKDRERKDSDKEREKDHVTEKIKVSEPKKVLNAKELIDTIPKTKEELFAYPVDWEIYDQHDLHERMRPWISKKITEFLGEEETTLVDFIVTNTCKHVTAASMLDLLESILDDEAELFVLKMWRMLIFEIRRIETGLASSKSKS
ncbi:unnamed protein product [Calypogeia fissa]